MRTIYQQRRERTEGTFLERSPGNHSGFERVRSEEIENPKIRSEVPRNVGGGRFSASVTYSEAIRSLTGFRVGIIGLGQKEIKKADPSVCRSGEYVKFKKEIKGFLNLSKGWDSYAAQVPSEIAVKNATDFIDVVERHAFKIEWVAPTTDDSVMVTLEIKGGRQEWDFYSDGDIAVTMLEASGSKHFLDVKPMDVERVLVAKYGGV